MPANRAARSLPLLAAGLLLAALAGCSGGVKTAVVQGSVSIDGTPITFGTVAFVGEDGRADSAMIQPDGTYTAKKVPLGEVVITVVTYPLPPQVRPPDAPPMTEPTRTGQARFVP